MQGRIKKDGGAAGDPEQRGGAGPDAAPQVAPAADAAATPKPKGSDGENGGAAPIDPLDRPVSRIRLRNWRISTRLVALLTLPVVAATSLGALRIQSSLEEVDKLEHMDQLTTLTERATKLADALQAERDMTAGPLIRGRKSDDQIKASRNATDKASESFHNASEAVPEDDDNLTGVRNTLVQIENQLHELNRIRARAYDNPSYVSPTAEGYSQLVEGLLSLSQDMAQASGSPEMIQRTRALSAFSSSKEAYSVQRAILAAALARDDGPALSENDRYFARTTYTTERSARSRFEAIYGDDADELLKGVDGDVVDIKLADKFRERAVNYENGIKSEKMSYLDWIDRSSAKMEAMEAVQTELLSQMAKQAKKLRDEAQREALLNGAMILIVLGVAVVGAAVVARSMIRSLRRLQDTAQEVAQHRLPELVKHLSEADPQEIDTSVQSIGLNSRDEIGRVAKAFDEVHREAVRLASEQALLRGNVNAMFTNLSRRSQGLIQRQLSLISELESREADPDQLSSLFKLDHLATRMRRNGENLLVLAGEEPGRRWTRPVPLVDVLRAAASEVEQYERIELTAVPSTEVAGRVVNDLVHLLAELLENATSFSSPQTRVRVTGHALPDGRVLIEIHDTGIGLSPEDLADINERLANPPTVDVSVSRRMGLFVVGRLSLRHGIRIQLRPSDSGGTTALVMLPVDITQGGSAPRPGGNRQQAPAAGGPQQGQPGAFPAGAGAGPAGRGPESSQRQNADNRAQSGPVRTGPAPVAADRNDNRSERDGNPQSGSQPPNRTLPPPPLPTRSHPARPQPAPQSAHVAPPQAPPSRPRQDPSDPPVPPQAHSPRGQQPADAAPWAGLFRDAPERTATPPDGTPVPGHPGWAEPAGAQDGHGRVESTLQFEAVRGGDEERPVPQRPEPPTPQPFPSQPPHRAEVHRPEPPLPQPLRPEQHQPEQHPFEQRRPDPQLPAAAEPMALPPAPSNADERTPIFDTMESNWFRSRTGRADRLAAAQSHEAAHEVPGTTDAARPTPPPPAPAPQRAQAPAAQPAAGRPPLPSRSPRSQQEPSSAPQAQPQAAVPDTASAQWRPSANDERWRRAEQVREPQAGGVTSSGLPRRVPRANLVPGRAQQEQQAQPSGPQVSRAPDEVRGRLTNLRRGIQQGRQAGGTDGRGFSPNHQER